MCVRIIVFRKPESLTTSTCRRLSSSFFDTPSSARRECTHSRHEREHAHDDGDNNLDDWRRDGHGSPYRQGDRHWRLGEEKGEKDAQSHLRRERVDPSPEEALARPQHSVTHPRHRLVEVVEADGETEHGHREHRGVDKSPHPWFVFAREQRRRARDNRPLRRRHHHHPHRHHHESPSRLDRVTFHSHPHRSITTTVASQRE